MYDEIVWMKVKITDIIWNCSDDNDVPENVIFSVEVPIDASNQEIADAIHRDLEDTYEIPVKGFDWEEYKD